MLTDADRERIVAEEKAKLEAEIKAAQEKKAGKAKKAKAQQGRDVTVDMEIVNTFNAKIAAACISKQLRGNITSAVVNVENTEISMVRQPKKKDTDPVRYKVSDGSGKDLIVTKKDAIIDVAERAVLVRDSIG